MRTRNFRLLWLGNSISALGTWLLIVAVPVHVYEITGSAMATGLALAVQAAPALVIGPWAGAFVDRWDRRKALAGASVASAAGVSLLLIDGLGPVYLGLLLESMAAVFLAPAGRALLPEITGTGPELASANAVSSVTAAVIRVTGPVAGTVAYVQGGLTLVVALDIASYVAAAVIFMAIRTPARIGNGDRHLLRELSDGVRYVAGTRLMRSLILTSWTFWTANAGLTALLVPFLVHKLGGSGADIGCLITALGIGYLAGAAISKPILRYPPKSSLTTACAATGLCFLALFNAPNLTVAMVAILASGVPGSLVMVIIQHTIQANVPSTLLGRTCAAFTTSDAAAALAGASLAALLSTWIGLTALLNLFSLGVLLAALAAINARQPPAPH